MKMTTSKLRWFFRLNKYYSLVNQPFSKTAPGYSEFTLFGRMDKYQGIISRKTVTLFKMVKKGVTKSDNSSEDQIHKS